MDEKILSVIRKIRANEGRALQGRPSAAEISAARMLLNLGAEAPKAPRAAQAAPDFGGIFAPETPAAVEPSGSTPLGGGISLTGYGYFEIRRPSGRVKRVSVADVTALFAAAQAGHITKAIMGEAQRRETAARRK